MPALSPFVEKCEWCWNRLRCMTLPEIRHRARHLLAIRLERLGLSKVRSVPTPTFQHDGAAWLQVPSSIDIDAYCRAADGIAQGRLDLFALKQANLGLPPQWNRDPLTGAQAPLVFGKTLNYRDTALVGDIKYLWEPSRHLQLVTLAQAYRLSGSDHYLSALGTQLRSWLDQCPYALGAHWCSSLELGIRLINWSLCWQLIGGLQSPLFEGPQGQSLRDRWLKAIYQHVHFIQGHYSRHSSANNHLIGEAAGLFIATLCWPYWPRFQAWQEEATALLEREIQRQHSADGVNREQAISYQQFVLDFLLLAWLAGDAHQLPFSASYRHCLERMLEYIASLMDVAGHIPMLGDADDGYVVRLAPEPDRSPYHALLALGAVLFKRGDFKAKAGVFGDKNRWLLGDAGAKTFHALPTQPAALPVRRAFPHGGYYILGNEFETAREVRIVADCGPLGYLNIAAHGHADALAFTLSAGGREILVDTGTYSYHSKKHWRDYFRGTRAHNTVCVDGLDQSESGGNFMWLRKAQAHCEHWHTDAQQDWLTASHDGYSRLPDPVIHRRTLRYMKAHHTLHINDQLQCRATHRVELNWHFAEHCRVTWEPPYIKATCGSVRVWLRLLDSTAAPRLLRGSEQPPGGWISRRFDVKEPTTTARWTLPIQGDSALCTELRIEFITA